jgi:HD superfamily phosphohydrolase YqeK
LLQLWGLPDEIVQAVAFHHHPHLLNPQNLAHPDNIIFVANVLAHERNPESYRDVWTSAFGTSVADNMCQRFAQWKSALPPRSEA